ncbi:MAG TPA: hypothetical protein VFU79_05545 [Nitrososphaeraceae archaeon]|nr:hypothetical protein [Nitrososphaeraceae archaeon]
MTPLEFNHTGEQANNIISTLDFSFRTAIGITPDGPLVFWGPSINQASEFFYFYFNNIFLPIHEF